MSATNTHIIARQSFRFRIGGGSDIPGIQSGISRLCNEELPARLNALFDTFAGPETVIRIPKLQVDLELDAQETLPADLGKKLVAQVEEALFKAIQGSDQSGPGNHRQSQLEAIVSYLGHGFTPWWAAGIQSEGLIDAAHNLDDQGLQFVLEHTARNFGQNIAARQRFAELTAAAGLSERLLSQWSGLNELSVKAFFRLIHSCNTLAQTARMEEQLAKLILKAEIQDTPQHHKLDSLILNSIELDLFSIRHFQNSQNTELIAQLAHSAATKHLAETLKRILADMEPEISNRMSSQEDSMDQAAHPLQQKAEVSGSASDEQRIRISNSGLVLIAPYLNSFFQTTGVVKNGALTDIPKAVALLRQCGFSNTDSIEQELILEKILCGLEPAESPGSLPRLTQEDIDECEALLSAMIANWSVLKQTSPDGLREAFLQREGILKRADAGWQLKVQRQSHDILLDFLPWSFTILKLPWMQGMMFVDWTK